MFAKLLMTSMRSIFSVDRCSNSTANVMHSAPSSSMQGDDNRIMKAVTSKRQKISEATKSHPSRPVLMRIRLGNSRAGN